MLHNALASGRDMESTDVKPRAVLQYPNRWLLLVRAPPALVLTLVLALALVLALVLVLELALVLVPVPVPVPVPVLVLM